MRNAVKFTEKMILVVDDGPAVADTGARVIDREGYCALAPYSAAETIAILREVDQALILSDRELHEISDLELAHQAQRLCPRTRVLLMSGDKTTETIKQKHGCKGCPFEIMAKPFGVLEAFDRIKTALGKLDECP